METDLITIKNILSLFCMALFALLLTGCVSSTLETSQFRAVGSETPTSVSSNDTGAVAQEPVELTGTSTQTGSASSNADVNGVDPTARATAVQEMRAKAEPQATREKTHIGALPETATEQLTPEQQRAKAAELKQAVTEAQASVTDDEIQSKQNSIQQLRRRGKSHYSDAVKRIEN